MTWTDPRWLAAAAAGFAALAALLGAASRKSRAAVRRLDPQFPVRSPFRPFLPAAAFALLAVALAGPQWGFRPTPTASAERDVVLVLDTSGSMLARDAAPDRFTEARLFARSYFRSLPENVRAAVVRVEGEGDVVCPLTLDRAAAEDAVAELAPRGSDSPGSDLGSGVRLALVLLAARPARARSIVLVSDGEDLDAKLAEAAAECRRRGVTLDAVSVGGTGGAPVPARDGSILNDAGSPVVSRAHPADLEGLARECGGRFAALGAPEVAAAAIAASRPAGSGPMGRGSREPVPRAPWPLAGAIAAWTLWSLPRGGEA